MLKVTLPREGLSVTLAGARINVPMGLECWAAFAGSDDRAIVDGNFAVLEEELQPVLKALRNGGINITAIHNSMTLEQPRVFFLHFWGVGSTVELARGFKAALAAQAKATPASGTVAYRHP